MIEIRDLRFAYGEGGFELQVERLSVSPRPARLLDRSQRMRARQRCCIWSPASIPLLPVRWISADKSLPPCGMRRDEIFASRTWAWSFKTSPCWIT